MRRYAIWLGMLMMAGVVHGQLPAPAFDSLELVTPMPPLSHIKKAKRFKKIPADSLLSLYERSHQQIAFAKATGDSSLWEEMLQFQRWYHWDKRDWDKAKTVRKQLVHLQIARGYVLNQTSANWVSYELLHELSIWHSSSDIPFPTVRMAADSGKFVSLNAEGIAWDSLLTQEGNFWIRVKLTNNDSFPQSVTLHPGRNPETWKYIEAYLIQGNQIQHQRTGTGFLDEDISIPGANGHVRFSLLPGQSSWLFFNVRESRRSPPGLSSLRIQHVAYEKLVKKRSLEMHINGIFQGIIVIQLLFFLLMFLTTKDPVHGYYSLYVAGLCIFIVSTNYLSGGLIYFHISQYVPTVLSIWIAGYGMMRFSASYLNLPKRLPQWVKPLRTYLIIYGSLNGVTLCALLLRDGLRDWIGTIPLTIIAALLVGCLFLFVFGGLIFIIFLGIQALRKGYKPATSFLLATLFLLAGFILPAFLVVIIELTPALSFLQPEYLYTILQGGIALQLSAFALGLGQKHNLLEKSRKDALQDSLDLQQRINAATERFVPYEFLTSLGRDSILEVNLGDQVEKEVTVFFVDIRDYTTISESMTPKENFSFLNSYLGRVGPIIKSNRGFVNQYYGDGIMALFMSGVNGEESPQDAVEAAIQMQHTLYAYNEERHQKGRLPIRIGIGIHTGPLMLGVIGDEKRMDVSVVADTVNTASRMEGLTKHFVSSVLVSESTLLGIKQLDQFRYRFLGLAMVKGKKDPISVYDFFDGDVDAISAQKAATLPYFEAGLKAYFLRDMPKALTKFEQVLAEFPEDAVAAMYRQRCLDLQECGVPDDWTGVENWFGK
ncbi:MAG: adenylate/guanylate cyclase domain-containing protein [Bacteroidota bacterium]